MIADHASSWPVTGHEVLGHGAVSDFVNDRVTTPSGESIARQYLTHPGAVGIITLNDADEIAVLRQYRHPIGMTLVEAPAGLLDGPDESGLAAAKRELAEEAQLAASDWRVLVDFYSTPGACQEVLRVFLARGLTTVPRPDGFVVEGEEAHMEFAWVPRPELLDAIRQGRCGSPSLVVGVLALEAARLAGALDELRPGDAPWRAREALGRRA